MCASLFRVFSHTGDETTTLFTLGKDALPNAKVEILCVVLAPWSTPSTTTKVSYCMRIHRVEKFLDDFERLHAMLASELIILPNFPEGGELIALFGEYGFRG